MKILLDECVPHKLKNLLTDQECQTVPEAGLAGRENGDLLTLAEQTGFELFLTMDKGMRYQQNLAGRSIAILISPSEIEPSARSRAAYGPVPFGYQFNPPGRCMVVGE